MALTALGTVGNALLQQGGNPSSDLSKAYAPTAQPASSARLQPGAPANTNTTTGAAEPSLAAVRLATRQVEQAVRAQASSLNFSIDQSSGKTMVKVTDSETGQVLRQIPSDEMLSLSQVLNNVRGLLLSQHA